MIQEINPMVMIQFKVPVQIDCFKCSVCIMVHVTNVTDFFKMNTEWMDIDDMEYGEDEIDGEGYKAVQELYKALGRDLQAEIKEVYTEALEDESVLSAIRYSVRKQVAKMLSI